MYSPNLRVLVVDDAKTQRKLIVMTLKKMGFTDILEAGDGAEAWTVLAEARPIVCLVLSDWNMPNSNGLDLLKRMRASEQHAKTPFIMLTAEAEQSQVVEAMKSGVNGYIVKPINPEQLSARLNDFWKD